MKENTSYNEQWKSSCMHSSSFNRIVWDDVTKSAFTVYNLQNAQKTWHCRKQMEHYFQVMLIIISPFDMDMRIIHVIISRSLKQWTSTRLMVLHIFVPPFNFFVYACVCVCVWMSKWKVEPDLSCHDDGTLYFKWISDFINSWPHGN